MCFEIYHVRPFIVLKGVWNDPRRCGIRSKPQHKCIKLFFFFFFFFFKVFGNHYVCIRLGLHTHAESCVCKLIHICT